MAHVARSRARRDTKATGTARGRRAGRAIQLTAPQPPYRARELATSPADVRTQQRPRPRTRTRGAAAPARVAVAATATAFRAAQHLNCIGACAPKWLILPVFKGGWV